jgi:TonB family protein
MRSMAPYVALSALAHVVALGYVAYGLRTQEIAETPPAVFSISIGPEFIMPGVASIANVDSPVVPATEPRPIVPRIGRSVHRALAPTTQGASGVKSSSTNLGDGGGSSVGIIEPIYPELSRSRGEEGKVELLATISPDGRVIAVDRIRSSGYAALDNAAEEALRSSRFKQQAGQAVFKKRLTIRFRLTE